MFCEWKGLWSYPLKRNSLSKLSNHLRVFHAARAPSISARRRTCGLFVQCSFRTAYVCLTKSSLVDCINGLQRKVLTIC
jgi:hypothetical protein